MLSGRKSARVTQEIGRAADTILRLMASTCAVFLPACAHVRAQARDDCGAVARWERSADATWLRLAVRNTSQSAPGGQVLRVSIGLGHVPFPQEVATPSGWVASIAVCADGTSACGVAWEVDGERQGIPRGAELRGFDVRFGGQAPASVSWAATLDKCSVGGLPGAILY